MSRKTTPKKLNLNSAVKLLDAFQNHGPLQESFLLEEVEKSLIGQLTNGVKLQP
jgi:hypothetical protein